MGLKKTILLVTVGMVSAGAGVAIPLVLNGGTHAVAPDPAHPDAGHATESHDAKADDHGKKDDHAKPEAKADDHAKKDDHAAAGDHGKDAHGKPIEIPKGPQFMQVGRLVVNLNEQTLTKYLTLDVVAQAEGKDAATVKSAIESRMPILRTWMTSHLADKSVDDLRGKVGINRLRREMQDQFNALLFDDGHERVTDILFEEFHIE